MYEEKEAELDRQDSLDTLEEERDVAKARSTLYQQQARRYQSREVRAKTYNIGELVLRLPEKKKDKLKPKWEGPFIIDKVLTGGAYRLCNASEKQTRAKPIERGQTPEILRLAPNSVFVSLPPLLQLHSLSSFLALFSIFAYSLAKLYGCPDRSGRTRRAHYTWGLPIRKLNITTLMASCQPHMRFSSHMCLFFTIICIAMT